MNTIKGEYIPDFFVIGAMKAGTTTLFLDLLDNPEIQRTRQKEVNFFLEDLGNEALNSRYIDQFSGVAALKCDVSPKYSQRHNYPGVASRIFSANPNAKIIYITRDPVERIVSHLQHNLLRGRFKESDLSKEVFDNHDYIESSRYNVQVNDYVKCFSKENILVLILEEMKADPERFNRRINSFLGTNTIAYGNRNFNVSEQRFKIFGYDAMNSLTRSRFIVKVYQKFWHIVNIKVSKPTLSADVKRRLIAELKDDTVAFAENFNLDLMHWKNFGDVSDSII